MATAEKIRPIAINEMTEDQTENKLPNDVSRAQLEIVGPADAESLSPEDEAELEQNMVELGKQKYGLDEAKAREWAQAFCRNNVVVETDHR